MKVNINGTEVEARQVAFSAIVEPWAEYQLQDGRTVRIKTVLTRLFETDEGLGRKTLRQKRRQAEAFPD